MNNTDIFIEKAKLVHGDKYDYSKVVYVNNKTKICIICPEHGEFWQRPDKHLSQKRGCPYCGGTKRRTTEEFVEASKKIWGDKYDYSKTQYLNDRNKICLIDRETGKEFWQNAKSHLNGYCHIDVSPRKNLTTGEFIARAKEKHGNRYDYSKVQYKNFETKVCIVCPKHGEFWQTPHMHLCGDGCPLCNTSKLEKEIIELLDKENIVYEYQKKFDWLKNKNKMSVDFFLPGYNLVIECQGRQHFREEVFFKSSDGYRGLVSRDKLKKKLCNEHGIKVLYFSHYTHDYWDKVYFSKEELLEVIRNGENEFQTRTD